MTDKILHPLVLWAQREKILYLKIEINDVEKLEVTSTKIHVKGKYGGSTNSYEAAIELFDDVSSEYQRANNDRLLELKFTKEKVAWWPRLLKEKSRAPWVKVDFDKWVDEDEDGADEEDDYMKYMRNLDGGDANFPNLDDMDDEDDDGAEGMPGLEDVEDDDESKKKDKEEVEPANNIGVDPISASEPTANSETDKLDSGIGAETLKTVE